MSRLEARIVAYDYLDRVALVVRLREVEWEPSAEDTWETVVSTSIQGEGEADRRAWLQDALVAILEAL